jgi:hypothetical protein
MSLINVRVPETTLLKPMPRQVRRFLKHADERMESYRLRMIHEKRSSPFIPSDYPTVYQWMRAIARRQMATGEAFLEWGSGFGVITCLARVLEFEAFGIESEPELVDLAEQLAADHELDVCFACGSFIPSGGDALVDDLDDVQRLDMAAAPAYDELDREPRDFDVIFGYPWPGHDRFLEDLFDHYASPGALLLMYRGAEDIRLLRKK